MFFLKHSPLYSFIFFIYSLRTICDEFGVLFLCIAEYDADRSGKGRPPDLWLRISPRLFASRCIRWSACRRFSRLVEHHLYGCFADIRRVGDCHEVASIRQRAAINFNSCSKHHRRSRQPRGSGSPSEQHQGREDGLLLRTWPPAQSCRRRPDAEDGGNYTKKDIKNFSH